MSKTIVYDKLAAELEDGDGADSLGKIVKTENTDSQIWLGGAETEKVTWRKGKLVTIYEG